MAPVRRAISASHSRPSPARRAVVGHELEHAVAGAARPRRRARAARRAAPSVPGHEAVLRAVQDRPRRGEARRRRRRAPRSVSRPSRRSRRRWRRRGPARPSRRRAARRGAPGRRRRAPAAVASSASRYSANDSHRQSMPSCSAVPGMSSTPSISSMRKSCPSGRTGAKPTPQLPMTTVVTPCQLDGVTSGSQVTWPS